MNKMKIIKKDCFIVSKFMCRLNEYLMELMG